MTQCSTMIRQLVDSLQNGSSSVIENLNPLCVSVSRIRLFVESMAAHPQPNWIGHEETDIRAQARVSILILCRHAGIADWQLGQVNKWKTEIICILLQLGYEKRLQKNPHIYRLGMRNMCARCTLCLIELLRYFSAIAFSIQKSAHDWTSLPRVRFTACFSPSNEDTLPCPCVIILRSAQLNTN